jgi:hypothetical protein
MFLGHMGSILNEGPSMYFVLEGSSSSATQIEHHASAHTDACRWFGSFDQCSYGVVELLKMAMHLVAVKECQS